MSKHQVLVIFGGGPNNGWIACDFAAFYKFFSAEASNAVTAIASMDIRSFVTPEQPLFFGKEVRRTVFAYEDDQFYQIVPAETFKDEILNWSSKAGSKSVAGDSVTLVFAGHGYEITGNWAIGFQHHRHIITPDEMMHLLSVYPASVFVKILNGGCYSGVWCETAQNAGQKPMLVQSAATSKESAWALRSSSGYHRCGIYPSAVLENLLDDQTVTAFHSGAVTSSLDSTGTHRFPHPQMVAHPVSLWTQKATAVMNVAGSALSWPLSVGERVRAAIATAMGFGHAVASVKLRTSPVTRGSPYVIFTRSQGGWYAIFEPSPGGPYVIFGRSPLWRISE
jgi:hypothetical protein